MGTKTSIITKKKKNNNNEALLIVNIPKLYRDSYIEKSILYYFQLLIQKYLTKMGTEIPIITPKKKHNEGLLIINKPEIQ